MKTCHSLSKQPSKSRLKELFEYDAKNGVLIWKVSHRRIRAGCAAGGSDCTDGYRVVKVDKVLQKVHRMIWIMFNGSIPKDMVVDHINGVRDDNRIENLRMCTKSENLLNKNWARHSSCSKNITVSYNSANLWELRVWDDSERIFLGTFETEEKAFGAYFKYKK